MLSLSEEAAADSEQEGDGRPEMASIAEWAPQQDLIDDPLGFGTLGHSSSTRVVPECLKEDLLCFQDLPAVQPVGDRVPEVRDQQDVPNAVAIRTNTVQNTLIVPEADLLGLNPPSLGSSVVSSGSSLTPSLPGTRSSESVSPSLRSRILRSPKRSRRPVLQKPESGPIPRSSDATNGRFSKIRQKKEDCYRTIPCTPLSPLGPGGILHLSQRDVIARHSLAQRAHEFTSNTDVRFFVGSWNVNGRSPPENLKAWLSCDPRPPDVYCIGFQEVDLSKEAFLFQESFREKEWLTAISSGLHPLATYGRVRLVRLVGMMLLVFIRKDLETKVTNTMFDSVGTGLMGRMGNKGGVGVHFMLHDTAVCVVNAHLAAHMDDVDRRNQDFHDVTARMAFQPADPDNPPVSISESDVTLWLGDLNYRIQGLPIDEVKSLVNQKMFSQLLHHDQLTIQRRSGAVFSDFKEGNITFPPTYKYTPGSSSWDNSDKGRVPAWCDRVLWRGDNILLLAYRSHMNLTTSDHKPVSASLRVTVRVVNPKKYKAVYSDVIRQLDQMENRFLPAITLSCQEFAFPAVRFRCLYGQELRVTNSGQVPCVFVFLPSADGTSYAPPWLRMEPSAAYLDCGETKSVHLEVYINQDVVRAFGEDLDRTEELKNQKKETILVLHLRDGKDYFVMVTVEYEPSCFGTSLERLCHTALPISEACRRNVKRTISSRDNHPAISIPKELWLLVDHLHQHALEQEDLFQQPGMNKQLLSIQEALDSTIPDVLTGENHSIAESLLIFLESLPQPVVPLAFYRPCLEAAGQYINSQKVVAEFPACHRATLLYLVAFLRELLKHSDQNGLNPKLLASLFGPLLLRPHVQPKNHKPQVQDKELVMAFLLPFLQ
uniref:inositol polyphosphate 5-phosphatase OCRL-like isoform X2 n=1 Tax=Myxine glutinosa TaxID=7769 RepID=UPI00358FA077